MSIKLGGKTPNDLGFKVLIDTIEPGLPETRDKTIVIPGRHGLYDFGADLGERRFELPCAMITKDATELQKKIRAFAAHLVDAYGRPKTLDFIIDTEPEKVYKVRYAGSLNPKRLAGLGHFTLPLVAYDPFSYAEVTAFNEDVFYDVGAEYDSGDIYPNPDGFEWKYERHMSGVYNHSGVHSPFEVEVVGTVTNPTITNDTTGDYITINTTLSAGQTLYIDSANYTVTIDGVNALQYMSGDFFDLIEGENDLVFTGSNPDAQVNYKWQHKFI